MRRAIARTWLLVALFAVPLVSRSVGPTVAQEEVRTAIGTIADSRSVGARFVAILDANGRAVVYFVSDNDGWNRQFSKWFVGQVSGNRLRARSDDGTEVTASLVGNQLVGTMGSLGWSGTLTGRDAGGLYQARQGDELHVVLLAPDDSWLGSVWSTSGQFIRTWDPGTSSVERLAGGVIRARQDGQSEYMQLNPIVPDPSGAWVNAPWSR
jgi:hypothetical protein